MTDEPFALPDGRAARLAYLTDPVHGAERTARAFGHLRALEDARDTRAAEAAMRKHHASWAMGMLHLFSEADIPVLPDLRKADLEVESLFFFTEQEFLDGEMQGTAINIDEVAQRLQRRFGDLPVVRQPVRSQLPELGYQLAPRDVLSGTAEQIVDALETVEQSAAAANVELARYRRLLDRVDSALAVKIAYAHLPIPMLAVLLGRVRVDLAPHLPRVVASLGLTGGNAQENVQYRHPGSGFLLGLTRQMAVDDWTAERDRAAAASILGLCDRLTGSRPSRDAGPSSRANWTTSGRSPADDAEHMVRHEPHLIDPPSFIRTVTRATLRRANAHDQLALAARRFVDVVRSVEEVGGGVLALHRGALVRASEAIPEVLDVVRQVDPGLASTWPPGDQQHSEDALWQEAQNIWNEISALSRQIRVVDDGSVGLLMKAVISSYPGYEKEMAEPEVRLITHLFLERAAVQVIEPALQYWRSILDDQWADLGREHHLRRLGDLATDVPAELLQREIEFASGLRDLLQEVLSEGPFELIAEDLARRSHEQKTALVDNLGTALARNPDDVAVRTIYERARGTWLGAQLAHVALFNGAEPDDERQLQAELISFLAGEQRSPEATQERYNMAAEVIAKGVFTTGEIGEAAYAVPPPPLPLWEQPAYEPLYRALLSNSREAARQMQGDATKILAARAKVDELLQQTAQEQHLFEQMLGRDVVDEFVTTLRRLHPSALDANIEPAELVFVDLVDHDLSVEEAQRTVMLFRAATEEFAGLSERAESLLAFRENLALLAAGWIGDRMQDPSHHGATSSIAAFIRHQHADPNRVWVGEPPEVRHPVSWDELVVLAQTVLDVAPWPFANLDLDTANVLQSLSLHQVVTDCADLARGLEASMTILPLLQEIGIEVDSDFAERLQKIDAARMMAELAILVTPPLAEGDQLDRELFRTKRMSLAINAQTIELQGLLHPIIRAIEKETQHSSVWQQLRQIAAERVDFAQQLSRLLQASGANVPTTSPLGVLAPSRSADLDTGQRRRLEQAEFMVLVMREQVSRIEQLQLVLSEAAQAIPGGYDALITAAASSELSPTFKGIVGAVTAVTTARDGGVVAPDSMVRRVAHALAGSIRKSPDTATESTAERLLAALHRYAQQEPPDLLTVVASELKNAAKIAGPGILDVFARVIATGIQYRDTYRQASSETTDALLTALRESTVYAEVIVGVMVENGSLELSTRVYLQGRQLNDPDFRRQLLRATLDASQALAFRHEDESVFAEEVDAARRTLNSALNTDAPLESDIYQLMSAALADRHHARRRTPTVHYFHNPPNFNHHRQLLWMGFRPAGTLAVVTDKFLVDSLIAGAPRLLVAAPEGTIEGVAVGERITFTALQEADFAPTADPNLFTRDGDTPVTAVIRDSQVQGLYVPASDKLQRALSTGFRIVGLDGDAIEISDGKHECLIRPGSDLVHVVTVHQGPPWGLDDEGPTAGRSNTTPPLGDPDSTGAARQPRETQEEARVAAELTLNLALERGTTDEPRLHYQLTRALRGETITPEDRVSEDIARDLSRASHRELRRAAAALGARVAQEQRDISVQEVLERASVELRAVVKTTPDESQLDVELRTGLHAGVQRQRQQQEQRTERPEPSSREAIDSQIRATVQVARAVGDIAPDTVARAHRGIPVEREHRPERRTEPAERTTTTQEDQRPERPARTEHTPHRVRTTTTQEDQSPARTTTMQEPPPRPDRRSTTARRQTPERGDEQIVPTSRHRHEPRSDTSGAREDVPLVQPQRRRVTPMADEESDNGGPVVVRTSRAAAAPAGDEPDVVVGRGTREVLTADEQRQFMQGVRQPERVRATERTLDSGREGGITNDR